ncbi:MAG: DUF1850 domain-containing protein [Synergistaceae bacterium]|nr:DUF1850 domain-containing protein [Synergistaceae bacterium]
MNSTTRLSEKIHRLFSKTVRIFTASLIFTAALAGWRVDFLMISADGNSLCSLPAAQGQRLIAQYVHSVEKTDVEDEYVVTGGKLWTWEEKVKSSNAGMPSVLPKYMSFLNSGGKMIFRGGRLAHETLNLRIGNKTFGRNKLRIPPFETAELYKTLPGRRLELTIVRRPYLYGRTDTSKLFISDRQKRK